MNRRSLMAGLMALPFAGQAGAAILEEVSEAAQLEFYKSTFAAIFADIRAYTAAFDDAEFWKSATEAAYATLNQIADRVLAMPPEEIGRLADRIFSIAIEANATPE